MCPLKGIAQRYVSLRLKGKLHSLSYGRTSVLRQAQLTHQLSAVHSHRSQWHFTPNPTTYDTQKVPARKFHFPPQLSLAQTQSNLETSHTSILCYSQDRLPCIILAAESGKERCCCLLTHCSFALTDCICFVINRCSMIATASRSSQP